MPHQDKAPTPKTSAEKLGEDISFGMQQTLACWATDFIDPYIGKWIQDKFKDQQHDSELKHTWGGEIIGDSAAFFVYLGVQQLMPQQMGLFQRTVKKAFSPFYDWAGKKSLHRWAVQHGYDEESEAFRKKLDEWKDFQADNFAKSTVISVSSIAANVATQKAMGNTHKLSVITLSKIAGAAITMATMLGLRMAIPKATHALDEELSDRYFSPLIRKAQLLAGAKVDEVEKPEEDAKHHAHAHTLTANGYPPDAVPAQARGEALSYSEKIRQEKKTGPAVPGMA